MYQVVTITQDELDLLAARETGWESVWGKLWSDLEERMHGMIISGSPVDEATWKLRPAFRMLCDTHKAQDFISEFIFDLGRKAEAGTLLLNFNGDCEQVLGYLAARDTVRKRALSYAGREARVGIIGMPTDSSNAPSVHSIEMDDGERTRAIEDSSHAGSRGGLTASSLPIEIEWDPADGVDAKVRMATLQCWPRLDSTQVGLDRLREDLKAHLHTESGAGPFDELLRRHGAAGARIRGRLLEIQEAFIRAPGMHAPTRAALDERRVGLEVELLLVPLSREDIQVLLALKTVNAAHKQLSRYRKAFGELFPGLQDRLEQIGAVT